MAKPNPIEECEKNWLFGAFWLALNGELAKRGFPEVGYKGAREAWETSLEIAKSNPAYEIPNSRDSILRERGLYREEKK